ncbi:DUF362 domain-containing protein [Litorilinea aerophila]|nr:DUF362 domain-containing protein [Litorilinea aerophila]MCC9075370.1 DUF362 domain-containing protein [Litorilinea aerophila]OUC06252.1 hypothetical protein RY27_22190 [Litorilinea aerophila]
MNKAAARVGLVHGQDRRANVYQALDLVREEVIPRLRPQVMLKPNFLSSTNQLASSHPDALRGAIDFLLSTPEPPQEILIAEGGNEKIPGEAFRNFGYHALVDEYDVPIRLVDLNQETEWVETPIILADHSETTVRMPKTVLDCPCTISMAVAKTHDVCVVTLALKNMIMGTICKADRVKMHGFPSHPERRLPDEARILNINLIRLARFLSPDIAVIDGTDGLQGNGPGGEDAVPGFGVAVASVDVFAADAVMARAMGFEPLELGLLHYGHQLGMGVADLAQIEVRGTRLEEVITPFKPHEKTPLQMQWHEPAAARFLPA